VFVVSVQEYKIINDISKIIVAFVQLIKVNVNSELYVQQNHVFMY